MAASSASFAINSFDSDLYDHVITSGSITFNEVWTNASETVTYLSSSMKVKQTKRNKINLGEQRIIARILNLRHRYKPNEKVRLRVFVENADRELVLRKTPYETPSEIYDKMYYRVRDAGYKVGIMKGFYLYHWYRGGNPLNKSHLL